MYSTSGNFLSLVTLSATSMANLLCSIFSGFIKEFEDMASVLGLLVYPLDFAAL